MRLVVAVSLCLAGSTGPARAGSWHSGGHWHRGWHDGWHHAGFGVALGVLGTAAIATAVSRPPVVYVPVPDGRAWAAPERRTEAPPAPRQRPYVPLDYGLGAAGAGDR